MLDFTNLNNVNLIQETSLYSNYIICITYTCILQYTGYSSTNGLQKVQIAIYNFDTDGLNITFDLEPQWRSECVCLSVYRECLRVCLCVINLVSLVAGRPPTDRSTPVNVVLNQTLIYFSDVIIGIGIIIAVVLLIFNIITVMKP